MATKCDICGKPARENTEGNKRYCQGHSAQEVAAFEQGLSPADHVRLLEKRFNLLGARKQHD